VAQADGEPPVDSRRWRMVVAYDGARFRGFAAQPGETTVAGALATALSRVARVGHPLQIVCAGRTDAGVHARGQVIHVDLPTDLPPVRARGGQREMGPDELARAVNRQLAPEVVVREAVPAPPGFDARRSATGRHYRYLVHCSPAPDPLLAPVAWHVADELDLRAMSAATDPVVGEHDFRAFCRRPQGTTAAEPIVRRVTRAGWRVVESPADGLLLRFDISAGSFCHQMVRSLVSALVDVGRGKGNAATMMALLRSGSRTGAPEPAPPHGLCLVRVSYDDGPGGGV
jgi:tRNA pseudouridine38-40 synthase